MFVCSVKATSIRLLAVVCVALTVMITLIAFIPTYGLPGPVSAPTGVEGYRYGKITSSSDVASFLSQFGWEVAGEPVGVEAVEIPREFDKVYAAYNEIQKGQGLNLSRYKGKEVTRYTFQITNYPGAEGTVYANVLVYRKSVIGGDVCSADLNGFVHGFEGQQGQ